ncbi:MAG: biopolymer transporter ExbD [Cellvibrionaceae bacterium]
MKKIKSLRSGDAEVNMTPMLDIVFIMLIFFIVASNIVRESGLDVTQRNEQNEEPETAAKVRAIYIQICADDSIFIDRRAVDARSIRAKVEAKLAAEPSSVVVIETQQQASTGSLVRVMDQAIAARAPVSIAPQGAQCALNA